MQVTLSDEEISARDAAATLVRVGTESWRTEQREAALDDCDAAVAGWCESLVLPDVYVAAQRAGITEGDVTTASNGIEADGPVLLKANASIRVHVRVDSRATVRVEPTASGDGLQVSGVDSPLGQVRVGFEVRVSSSPPITVPRTREGVATALT